MTMQQKALLERAQTYLLASVEVTRQAAAQCLPSVVQAAEVTARCFTQGGKLLICGNGGSAADSQHIATEFTSTLRREFERPALPAIALTTDTSFLTARSNDFSFDQVFARQVEALGRPGDVLLGISTSGNSKNVVRAVEQANAKNMKTIALTGHKGGQLKGIAGVLVAVPNDVTGHVQEAHIALYHVYCDLVEVLVFGAPQGTKEQPI